MNDPELDEHIRSNLNEATRNIRHDLDAPRSPSITHASNQSIIDHRKSGVWNRNWMRRTKSKSNKEENQNQRRSADLDSIASAKEHLNLTEDVEVEFLQPTLWWFTSTAFPVFAGTFGPLANLFSVCALVETWRINTSDESKIKDPAWILALNAISLFTALLANILLLLNFARRIRYNLAQPATILLWYISSIILIPPLILTHTKYLSTNMELSQSYYYGLIAASLYLVIATLLLWNFMGARIFHAYPPSFGALTIPQRTLMLQTIVFSMYLALGAGIFARIEGWNFVNGIYWAEYTLLTIGLGADFALKTTGSRMLLIPFAAFGIVLVGIIVGSVRGLVLERAKVKVAKRRLMKERERIKLEQQEQKEQAEGEKQKQRKPKPHKLEHKWRKAEFVLMREIERKAEKVERYTGLAVAVLVYLIVWIAGSLIFWATEGEWTYPAALYFTYTSITTIGYGDLFPSSQAGRPFFVFWTLLAVPAVTILVSHMGSTVIRAVSKGVELLGRWTVLPEPKRVFKKLPRDEEKDESPKPENNHHHHHHKRHDPAKAELSNDIQRLGSGIMHNEEAHGKANSLPARLAREIRNISRDIDSPRKYDWEEWVRWLELLCENPQRAEVRDRRREREVENDMLEAEERWRGWSWLGDDGPLLSSEEETQWVLGKLCERLEEVLEMQIEVVESHGGGR